MLLFHYVLLASALRKKKKLFKLLNDFNHDFTKKNMRMYKYKRKVINNVRTAAHTMVYKVNSMNLNPPS